MTPGHHHGHSHGTDVHGNERRVLWAMGVTGVFMLAEVIGGLISGSLALLADAAHMLTDVGSLALAWTAFRLAARPADAGRTYGYHRLQILAAFVNGITLFAIIGWIVWEAVLRLYEPHEVLGGTMLAVALLGLAANLVVFRILHGGDRENLNIRGAMLHVLGDLLGSLAAVIAAGIILLTGWTPIDPLLSMLIGAFVLLNAWRLVKEAGHILLEGTPRDIDVASVAADLSGEIPEVADVHHVHAWSLTQERPLVTLHARVAEDSDHQAVLAKIQRRLREVFGVSHATVQIETGHCADHTEADGPNCR